MMKTLLLRVIVRYAIRQTGREADGHRRGLWSALAYTARTLLAPAAI
jgi:hypothetical protein